MMDDGGKAPLLSSQDPYYAVRDAVDDSVRTLRVKFDSWKGLLQSVDTATSVEFKTLHEELKKELTKMGEMLRKVRGSVDGVERNRAKFSHIDDKELASRKGALEKIDATLTSMRTEFNSRETSAKMESDERKALSRRVASEVDESSRSSSSYYKSNASHLTGTAGEQVLIKKEQEVVLGKLDAGLSTLKEMARTIDDELEGQNKLLESIDKETDKAQGSMDQAIKSIEKLLGTSNTCQLCTILSLVVIFVIVTAIALT